MKPPDTIDKKILSLWNEGKTAREIGKEINLSRRTIESRLARMRQNYDCKNNRELLRKVGNFQ